MKFYPHGPTWRTADDTGNTITHYISAFGSLQLLQELLERMMPQALALEALSGTNLALQTPMHMACAFNNTSNALFLAELMPNNLLHQADSQGNTPFHYACLHGNNKLVKKLFSSEGLVLRNVHGSNSLGLAWANGHSKVLGQVLHQYPDLEVVCSNQLVDFKNSQQYLGWFRRLMHINQHRPDLCLVEFPHEVEGKYWEPTRWWEVETAVRYGKLSMVCAFVQAGAVVHLQTILLLCAKYGKLELFDKLLSDSQQSLFLDSFREQVLVEVFSRGYPRFCSRILSWIETNHLTHTVSNLVDAQGNGLLHWAARHRWLKLFTTLEERFHCSLHSPNNVSYSLQCSNVANLKWIYLLAIFNYLAWRNSLTNCLACWRTKISLFNLRFCEPK
jgi:ankyrin repeat protein